MLATVASAMAAPRPNFLWIMADDLGYGEVGVYPAGSAHGRLATPNLDRFASSGMRFTDAYAGYTVCAPSRTTLMTGFHSGHFTQQGLSGTAISPDSKLQLLPELLKSAGYATAAIGKIAPLTNPTQQGFDYFIGQVDQGYCHNMYPRFIDEGNATSNINLTLNWAIPVDANAARAACMANPQNFNYTVDITSQQALGWLLTHVASTKSTGQAKPFFLYQAYTVPHAGGWGHAPLEPEQGAPVPSDGQYAPQTGWPHVERDHAAVVTYLDARVGEMMDALDTLQLTSSTLVVFASDNGAHLEGGHSQLFFNSTGGLSGHKRSLFEGGVRSPTMVRWPGTIAAGTVSPFRWAFWDALPTFAELASVPAPSGRDGVSIVPTLMGKPQPAKEYLYFTWPGADRGTAAEALPEGWRAEQDARGTLVYVRVDTGAVQTRHPSLLLRGGGGDSEAEADGLVEEGGTATATADGKGPSGFAIVSGEWKALVPHCAAASPSAADLANVQLYHLPSDWPETNDLSATSTGKPHAQRLLGLAMNASVMCGCFQC